MAGSRTVRIDWKDISTAKNLDMICPGAMQSEVRPRRALDVSHFLLCFALRKELHVRPLTAGQPFQDMHLYPPGT